MSTGFPYFLSPADDGLQQLRRNWVWLVALGVLLVVLGLLAISYPVVATIATVEHNLQTIDEAIRQAREALAADPANTYLSGHLVEARRRKLDLLRRAAALTVESD